MTYLLSFLFLCLVSVCSAKELKIFLLTGQSPGSREGQSRFSGVVEEV